MEVEKAEKSRNGDSTNCNDRKYITQSCTASNEILSKKKAKQAESSQTSGNQAVKQQQQLTKVT